MTVPRHPCQSLDLSKFGSAWQRHPDGIWRTGETADVSYPSDGNNECFELERDSFWFGHRAEALMVVLKLFPPEQPFFDIGGGNGFTTLALQNNGIDAVLVEPGADGVRNARDRGVENVVAGAWSADSVTLQSAPSAGLFDVLEHIEDDLDFLRQVGQTMRSGGRLYLTVPAFTSLWSYEDVHAGHFRRYRLGQLSQVVRKAGFEVDFATYLFSPLPLPILLQRSLPSRLGLRQDSTLDQATAEHSSSGGVLFRLLNAALGWELKRLARGRTVPVGSSCLVIARKPD